MTDILDLKSAVPVDGVAGPSLRQAADRLVLALSARTFVRRTARLLRARGAALISVLLRLFGLAPPARPSDMSPRQVIIIGGYGYGNTGDEAQLGANLSRWRAVIPKVDILVLSPNPAYTAQHHDCRSAAASRAVIFGSNRQHGLWNASPMRFKLMFWPKMLRMELNATLMRAGLAPWFATSAETHFLSRLQSAAAVHVSGGGFMTGPTRSRLWDTCLILRLCQYFHTPYFLTGQTLGVFENAADRWLARTGLRRALGVSLRDPGESEHELISLGVDPHRLISTVDDALFCDSAGKSDIAKVLECSDIVPDRPFLTVHYHWWGMDGETRETSARRLAELLDGLRGCDGCQILFVPMTPSDEEAQQAVISLMSRKASMLTYDYDYAEVRGAIGASLALVSFKHHPLIFAMGERTPCVSISFDPYYHRKNIGAMKNLGQERFCLDRGGFFGPAAERLIDEVLAQRDEISATLDLKLHAPREGQAGFFSRMLDGAGLGMGAGSVKSEN